MDFNSLYKLSDITRTGLRWFCAYKPFAFFRNNSRLLSASPIFPSIYHHRYEIAFIWDKGVLYPAKPISSELIYFWLQYRSIIPRPIHKLQSAYYTRSYWAHCVNLLIYFKGVFSLFEHCTFATIYEKTSQYSRVDQTTARVPHMASSKQIRSPLKYSNTLLICIACGSRPDNTKTCCTNDTTVPSY